MNDRKQCRKRFGLMVESTKKNCDWSLVVLAFEESLPANKVFSAAQIQTARDTARCWHPDQYEAHTGEVRP